MKKIVIGLLIIICFIQILRKFRYRKKIKNNLNNEEKIQSNKPELLSDQSHSAVTEHRESFSDVKFDYKQYVEKLKLKNQFWDGAEYENMEKKIYLELREFINPAYLIIPHVALREIFRWQWDDDWYLTNRINAAHFDFGIYDSSLNPVVFIEVIGKKHKDDLQTKNRDEFKEELLRKNGLKLIWIDACKAIPDAELKNLVRKIIMNEVPDRNSYPMYCPLCHSKMQLLQNSKSKEYFYKCPLCKRENNSDKNKTYDVIKDIEQVPFLYEGIKCKIIDNCKN